MSAWIVDSEVLTIIRNTIINLLNITDKEANKLVKSWAKLNRYAITARYGTKSSGFFFTNTTEITTPVQLYKYLQCLQYQCNEGTPEKDLTIPWFTLAGVLTQVQQRFSVNEESHEYRKAAWG